MKGYKKILGFTVFLLFIFQVVVFAADKVPSNIKLVGEAEGIVFIPGDEPFLNKMDMLPGDSVGRELIFENNYDKAYELFLKAERVTPNEKDDLLNKLELQIVYDNKVIYQGPASGEDGLKNNISLGKFKPGDKSKLYAVVKLDGKTVGNEYKNKLAQVDWIFTAVADKETIIDKEEEVQTFMGVKTGDLGIAGIVVALIISGFIVVIIKKDKRGVNLIEKYKKKKIN